MSTMNMNSFLSKLHENSKDFIYKERRSQSVNGNGERIANGGTTTQSALQLQLQHQQEQQQLRNKQQQQRTQRTKSDETYRRSMSGSISPSASVSPSPSASPSPLLTTPISPSAALSPSSPELGATTDTRDYEYTIEWKENKLGLSFTRTTLINYPMLCKINKGLRNNYMSTELKIGDYLISANELNPLQMDCQEFFTQLIKLKKPVLLKFMHYSIKTKRILFKQQHQHHQKKKLENGNNGKTMTASSAASTSKDFLIASGSKLRTGTTNMLQSLMGNTTTTKLKIPQQLNADKQKKTENTAINANTSTTTPKRKSKTMNRDSEIDDTSTEESSSCENSPKNDNIILYPSDGNISTKNNTKQNLKSPQNNRNPNLKLRLSPKRIIKETAATTPRKSITPPKSITPKKSSTPRKSLSNLQRLSSGYVKERISETTRDSVVSLGEDDIPRLDLEEDEQNNFDANNENNLNLKTVNISKESNKDPNNIRSNASPSNREVKSQENGRRASPQRKNSSNHQQPAFEEIEEDKVEENEEDEERDSLSDDSDDEEDEEEEENENENGNAVGDDIEDINDISDRFDGLSELSDCLVAGIRELQSSTRRINKHTDSKRLRGSYAVPEKKKTREKSIIFKQLDASAATAKQLRRKKFPHMPQIPEISEINYTAPDNVGLKDSDEIKKLERRAKKPKGMASGYTYCIKWKSIESTKPKNTTKDNEKDNERDNQKDKEKENEKEKGKEDEKANEKEKEENKKSSQSNHRIVASNAFHTKGKIGLKFSPVSLKSGSFLMITKICNENCCTDQLNTLLIGDLLVEINNMKSQDMAVKKIKSILHRSDQYLLKFRRGPLYNPTKRRDS